jgi:hypothetical protein
MDRQPFLKTAMMSAFADEMQKISQARAMQKLASTGLSLDDLIKVAEHDDYVLELMKQAGIFTRMGRATKKGVEAVGPKVRNAYNAAQVATGNVMTGSFGHAGEHAAQKLITTQSPLKAAIVAGTDPHVLKAVAKSRVGQGVAKGAKKVSKGASNVLERARQAVMPVPSLKPAYA